MKKTLKLWMLLVIALSIASCTDNSDEPVVNKPSRRRWPKKGAKVPGPIAPDVDSFLEGFAGELFEKRYVGLDDFELICFLVIK